MSSESPLAEEISSTIITPVDSGGIDYSEHPRISFDFSMHEDEGYNQAGQSTTIFQMHENYPLNIYPKFVLVKLEAENEDYFFDLAVDGAAFFLYQYDGQGSLFGTKIAWVCGGNHGKLMRGIRKEGFIHALCTQVAPQRNWKVTQFVSLGIEDHYYLEGWVNVGSVCGWFGFLYNMGTITMDTITMRIIGSTITIPS